MIQYSLICDKSHKFDAWFRNAEAYDEQASRGIVSCPVCASSQVTKAIMAPALARTDNGRGEVSRGEMVRTDPSPTESVAAMAGHPREAEIRAFLRALRRKVTAEADYVGDRFAEEARKIHFNEVDPRGIYGEATRDDVAALLEDGIDILPLPTLPDEAN